MASILNATTPIFMVVVAHLLTHDEKLSVNKVAGIGFGFAGTMVLVGPDVLGGGSGLLGELAVIAASCVYAFAAVYSRRFTGLPPLQAATGQITGGAIILLPLSLWLDHPWTLPMPGLSVWVSPAGYRPDEHGHCLLGLLQDAGDHRRHLYLAGDVPSSRPLRCCWACCSWMK